MLGRIVEIADDRRHLALYRGFLLVRDLSANGAELGRVPLDDITALIASAHGISYTHALLVALAERSVPFVLCAANHNAVGMLLSLDGHHLQAARMQAQAASGLALRKRLWAALVRAKLAQQATVLQAVGSAHVPLQALVRKVRSGDPDNIEAQGARRYWPLLFGHSFRRDRHTGGLNGLLNYGYTVARAATARAVVAAGLHPSLGLHHSNAANAMRLVDDLIEPFRPLVDWQVWRLQQAGIHAVTPEAKHQLVQLLHYDLDGPHGTSPVSVSMQRLARSLASVFQGEQRNLTLPAPQVPQDGQDS